MSTEINSIDDLEKFIKSHLDYCHEVRMGRVKDDEGKVIEFDTFWKGYNGAYVNCMNAVLKLKAKQ